MKRFLLFATLLLAFLGTTPAQIGGYAIDLDGTDDYIDLPDGVYFSDNTFTVEAWVYVRTLTNWSRLIDFGNGTPSYNIIIATSNQMTGKPYFHIYGTRGDAGITSDSVLRLNTWNHLAVVLNGTTARIFINGVETKVSTIADPDAVTRRNNYIGKSGWNEDPETNMKIDEFRIWNTARTVDQIRANMYRELTGTEDSLVVYYKMSTGSGTTVTDNKTTGTAYNGTLTGGPVWKASGCLAGPGKALSLDGTNEYLSATLNNSFGTTFTQEVWIYPTDAGLTYRGILGYHPEVAVDGRDRPPSIYQYGRNIHYGFGDGTAWNATISTGDKLKINSWNHIAVTFDGTNYLLYINGEMVHTFTGAAGKTPVTTKTYYFGKVDNPYVGYIDEVRFWSDVRTSEEIRFYMMTNVLSTLDNLEAYYRFDESDGNYAFDLVGTTDAQKATLNNMEAADRIVSSAYNTWIGSESSSASTTSNWSRGSFSSTDNFGIYKQTSLGNSININSSFSGNHFSVTTSAGMTLAAGLTVSGNLFLNGTVDLAGNTVSLGSTGKLYELNGRFYGASGQVTFGPLTYPSSSSLLDTSNIGLAVKLPSSISNFKVTRKHDIKTNESGTSIERNFLVENLSDMINPEAIDPAIQITYKALELNGIAADKLVLARSTDNGTTWVTYPSTVNQTDSTVTADPVPSIIGLWTLTDSDNPLPVELTSFTASTRGNTVTLNWETKTEVMNHGFEVERKTANTEWAKIGFVEGHYTTNSPKYYSFTDKPDASGKIYYRLKQIDTDGAFEYSPEVMVDMGLPTEFALEQNYPNPFNPETVVRYALPVAGDVSIVVYNALGQEVATLVNAAQEAGNHQITFKADNLPSGIYFCKMTAGKFTFTRKMMLLR